MLAESINTNATTWEFHLQDGATHFSISNDKALMCEKALVIADPHFGKTTHFRKAGLPVPRHAKEVDFIRLENIILSRNPEEVIFLGDLFHSDYNSEWDRLKTTLLKFPKQKFVLVKGNHDILEQRHYDDLNLEVVNERKMGSLLFTHEPLIELPSNSYNVHGHLHPGVVLKGKGRQSTQLPCFHFGATHGCLPAFGQLTGTMKIRPVKGDDVFAVLEDRLLNVSP